MRERSLVVAIDLGAESGRVVHATMDGGQIDLEIAHRFPNGPLRIRDHLYWDILRLWGEIQAGLETSLSKNPASIGIDTWAVDFALLDAKGHMLSNPVHYRDARTEGMLERAFQRMPKAEIFEQTGIQF